ncbi:MAG: C40 family peptidase [Ferruginibacter sp.]
MQLKYAMCILPLAHVRLLPDHRDEMTSQFLFGECATVLEDNGQGWLLLQNSHDGYTGWCRSNQFLLSGEPFAESTEYTADWVNEIIVNNKKMMLPFASSLSLLKIDVKDISVLYSGNIIDAATTAADEANINKISKLFSNTTYLWGGKSIFGIDCSGYVQTVFRMMNIKLLRDAKLQVTQGSIVGFLQEAICGDLAFFDEGEEIMHVGILLNEHEIIHASGNVRIDKIDNEGIIHSDTGKRTHRLRIIKRVITYV